MPEIVQSELILAKVYDFKLFRIEVFKEGYRYSHIPIVVIGNVAYPVHIDSIEIVKVLVIVWNVGNMKMQEWSNLFRMRRISEPSNGCNLYKVLRTSFLIVENLPCDNILLRDSEEGYRNRGGEAKA